MKIWMASNIYGLSTIVFALSVICMGCAKLPEEDLLVPDLIRYWNYPVEVHEAKTEDGYYLTLHRIPRGRNHHFHARSIKRPVVFLQHGLLCSSSNWVTNMPNNSLGFMLADAGFDVWLGNARGNTYSRKHESLSVDSAAFWDFSFDELAKYDLPGMLTYVLNVTREKQLYYVGHSQGTMMIFAGLSENEALQRRIKTAFLLAPVTRLKNIYSPIKYLALFEPELKVTFELLRIHDFLPSNKLIRFFADKLCPIDEQLCATVMELLAGYDKSDLNTTRIPVYYSHTPAGTSVKNMYHFAQLVESKVFQKYDYGDLENLIRYNSLRPPIYHFEKIGTPIVMMSGSEDWLAAPDDVTWTAQQLPNLVKLDEIKGYNHLDFIWGMSAHIKVYRNIIKGIS